jgi:hypothetical protein
MKHHAIKAYGGVEIAPSFLILAVDGGEWSASRLRRFTPRRGGGAPGTRCIGGCEGPRAGLDAAG